MSRDDKQSEANIYLEAKLPKDGCKITKTTRENCDLNVSSKDSNKRILNFMAKFPAGVSSLSDTQGSMGGGTLATAGMEEYLYERAKGTLGFDDEAYPHEAMVPILVYTTYEYNGKIYTDRSFYMLVYGASKMFDKEQIIPIGMVFCGRPSNETTAIDFVIDPWKTTRVGYSDKPSTAIMFGCGDKYYIEVYSKTGAYDVQTDEALASDGKTRPKGVSISVSGTSFRARSATDKPIDLGIRYRLVADSLIDNRLIENTASH